MPQRRRYNCNAEHCGRGTSSRSIRGGQSRIKTWDLPDARYRTYHRATTHLIVSFLGSAPPLELNCNWDIRDRRCNQSIKIYIAPDSKNLGQWMGPIWQDQLGESLVMLIGPSWAPKFIAQIWGPLRKEDVCPNFALTVGKFVFSNSGNFRAKQGCSRDPF